MLTAKLLNAHGRVTTHICVRLELRTESRGPAIWPMFLCTETSVERQFGRLRADTTPGALARLFPGIVLVDATETCATCETQARRMRRQKVVA